MLMIWRNENHCERCTEIWEECNPLIIGTVTRPQIELEFGGVFIMKQILQNTWVGKVGLGSSVKVQFRYSEKYRETSRLQETLGKSALKLVFFRFRALSIAHQYNFSYNPNPEQVSGLKWWVGEGGGEMGFPNKPVYYAIFQLYTQALAFFLVLRVCLV